MKNNIEILFNDKIFKSKFTIYGKMIYHYAIKFGEKDSYTLSAYHDTIFIKNYIINTDDILYEYFPDILLDLHPSLNSKEEKQNMVIKNLSFLFIKMFEQKGYIKLEDYIRRMILLNRTKYFSEELLNSDLYIKARLLINKY